MHRHICFWRRPCYFHDPWPSALADGAGRLTSLCVVLSLPPVRAGVFEIDAAPQNDAAPQQEPPRRGQRRKPPTAAAAAAAPPADGEGITTRRGLAKLKREASDDGDDDPEVVIPEASTKVTKVGQLLPDVPVCYETIRAREAVRRQAMVRPSRRRPSAMPPPGGVAGCLLPRTDATCPCVPSDLREL